MKAKIRAVTSLFCAAIALVFLCYWSRVSNREIEDEVRHAYDVFQNAIAAGDFSSAYQMMCPEYRQTHSVDEFQVRFGYLGESAFRCSSWAHVRLSAGYATITPGSSLLSGVHVDLLRMEEEWYLTGKVGVSTD